MQRKFLPFGNWLARFYLRSPPAIREVFRAPKWRRVMRDSETGKVVLATQAQSKLVHRRNKAISKLRAELSAARARFSDEEVAAESEEIGSLLCKLSSFLAKNSATLVTRVRYLDERTREHHFDNLAFMLKYLRLEELSSPSKTSSFFTKTSAEIQREAEKLSSKGLPVSNAIRIEKLISEIRNETEEELRRKLERIGEEDILRRLLGG